MADHDGPLDPLTPWYRTRRGVSALAAAMVVCAAVVVLISWPSPPDTSCGTGAPGLQWAGSGADRECVGLTNERAFAADPRLKSITEKIAAENRRVRDQWDRPGKGKRRVDYVKVGLLTPMTESDTSALPIGEIRSSLEGAYIAQCRANGCPGLPRDEPLGIGGEAPPLIQLVIADEGRGEAHWKPAVDQLTALARGAHPLVAVTGMGISIEETRKAAVELSKHGIPSIGAVLTATDVNADRLFKVSPSNLDYARALRRYVDRSPLARSRGYLVFDSRNDNYVRTLRQAFDTTFPRSIGDNRTSFVGATGNEPAGTPQLFTTAVNNICQTKADMVLYAGRDRDLGPLITALAGRQCDEKKPLTLLTGATGAFQQAQDRRGLLTKSRISVLDVSSAHPSLWLKGQHAPRGFPAFHDSMKALGFRETVLVDGYAIMHHDAVLTAVWATRNVTAHTGDETPDINDVYHELTNLNHTTSVPAAGGQLSFDDASHGWPHNKPVPLIRIPDQGEEAPPPYRTP
ncbi:hypothetical protein [Streptomyces chattanoogensis]|uniref:Leucine-binding protein domain-containing protein n=1 Tax=Streptomyces chattanoogensis TaxID=66876 RepID=A0A0N0XU66_9ACTN|nr:hypothetical protein [Streptomyces chattanoogensis]KPC59707.1 hypothetical protein ADL29_33170 [Streptomyces chattanoogensis]